MLIINSAHGRSPFKSDPALACRCINPSGSNKKKEKLYDFSEPTLSFEFCFFISDDGIVIPEDLDWRNTDRLGLQLVIILAENQLDGTVYLDWGKETRFTVRFRHEENE